MQIILKDNEYQTKDIYLTEGKKTLIIMFGGTGDLYWIINNKDCKKDEEYSHDCFEITKENYQIYSLFEQLIDDIKNINIFDKKEMEFSPYVEKESEYLEEIEFYKNRYRKYNTSYYNDLYDEKTNIITLVSDETGFEVANKVQIIKNEEKFKIEFLTQPYIDGYEREGNMLGIMGIRFRNSGSRYDPFNIVFMRMFLKLQQVDDINDFGHQIHIEEFLYQKRLLKKLLSNKNSR